MTNHHQPVFANGKICYLEIPAIDIHQSAEFYSAVFGWKIRNDGEEQLSFDDTAGQVSGTWVLNRQPADTRGIMISLMVYDIDESKKLVIENGGKIISSPGENDGETFCIFSDPAGNVFCMYEDKSSIDSMTSGGM